MTVNKINSLRLLLALLLILPLVFGIIWFKYSSRTSFSSLSCVITQITGNVTVRYTNSTDWTQAIVGNYLKAGERIKTGASSLALLTFSEGSSVELRANTEIDVKEISVDSQKGSTYVSLDQIVGKTLNRVEKLIDTNSQFEIITPSAAAGVRGTTYTVEVLAEGTTFVTVTDGTVRVTAEGTTIEVSAGEESVIYPGSPPGRLLPAGFISNKIPDVTLKGYYYYYMIQESPIISSYLMQLGIPQLNATSVQVWFANDVSEMGWAADFTNQADASKALALMTSSGPLGWSLNKDNSLYVVNDASTEWATSLTTAIALNKMVDSASRFSDVMGYFDYFPSKPPLAPQIAGFIDLSGNVVDSIGNLVGFPLTDFKSALVSAKISKLAFVAYSGQALSTIPTVLSGSNASDQSLCLLGVGESSYSSILLSLLFDQEMSDVGFSKVNTGGITIYELSFDSSILLIARQGSMIFMVTSQDKGNAEKLLLSCFK